MKHKITAVTNQAIRYSLCFQLCTAFDLVTSKCTNRKGEPNSCSCTEVTPNIEYRFTLNLTAYTYFSRQEVWMEWPGPPKIVSVHYQFPEIRGMVNVISILYLFYFCLFSTYYISIYIHNCYISPYKFDADFYNNNNILYDTFVKKEKNHENYNVFLGMILLLY